MPFKRFSGNRLISLKRDQFRAERSRSACGRAAGGVRVPMGCCATWGLEVILGGENSQD